MLYVLKKQKNKTKSNNKTTKKKIQVSLGFFVLFNGTSTFDSYLMPNPLYIYDF